MIDRFNFTNKDRRKFVLIAGVIAVLTILFNDGTAFVRVTTGLIAGLIGGVAFLVTTFVLRKVLIYDY